MWKAFAEMEELGFIGSKRPRMVSVQSEGCAPIVKAWKEHKDKAELWEHADTVASGLRVPSAVADFLILHAIRESKGCAISVSDEELLEGAKLMARNTGMFPAPEGGACLAAQIKLIKEKWIGSGETVVLFSTGSGLKYREAFLSMKPSK